MRTIEEVFGRKKVALPVIHILSEAQALRNVAIAVEADADGVFLIHHQGNSTELLEVGKAVRSTYPDLWMGYNFLGESAYGVWSLVDSSVDGIWVDNAGIEEEASSQVYAQRIDAQKDASGWEGLYFGGVAFKYQRPVEDLESAGEKACFYLDVPTTSGQGTGYAADLERIVRLKSRMGDHPLGIASGITPDNVELYLPHVDAFLVATGISSDFHNLDSAKTELLVKKIHGSEEG